MHNKMIDSITPVLNLSLVTEKNIFIRGYNRFGFIFIINSVTSTPHPPVKADDAYNQVVNLKTHVGIEFACKENPYKTEEVIIPTGHNHRFCRTSRKT